MSDQKCEQCPECRDCAIHECTCRLSKAIRERDQRIAELTAQVEVLRRALEAWEHWYAVDSSEFNRDTAREEGLEALATTPTDALAAKPEGGT